MASTLPNPDGCCDPCIEPTSIAVPGPQGTAGANGTNGTNGVNAFTISSGFTLPPTGPLTPTVSRERTTNVAKLIMGAAHNLTSGQKVDVSGLGDASYNLSDVVITVVNATTFTYPSVGADEAVTADVAGSIANIRSTVTVVSSKWMVVGEKVFFGWESGGLKATMTVATTPLTPFTTVEVVNVETSTAYLDNSPAGTVFPNLTPVTPSGLQGPAGTNGTSGANANFTYITKTDHTGAGLPSSQPLSLLATGYMKSAIGTGVVTTQAVPIPIADGGTAGITAAAARTALGAAPANATYITQVAEAGITGNQILGALPTNGYLKVTVPTGVLSSIAVPIPIVDGGTGGITAAAARAALSLQRAPQDILIYQHQLAAATSAGAATLGSWETVPINTEVVDTGGHGSIAANTITLATGVYRVHWRVCGYQVDTFQSRLFNVTTATISGLGSNARSAAADTCMGVSVGESRITITAATEDIRIQSQCQTTNAASGFGISNAFGGTQVYAGIWLEREIG